MSKPNHSSSHSAVIFAGALVQRLENHPTLRLPSTYVGVRRVRPTLRGGKRKRRSHDEDGGGGGGGGDDDGWVPNDVGGAGGGAPVREGEGAKERAAKCEHSRRGGGGDPSKEEIVYKVTNPDGTQRRMTNKEKKQLKYELARAKRDQKKEERQAQHEKLLREQKAGKRERREAKRRAWKDKKKRQRLQTAQAPNDDGDGRGSSNERGDERKNDCGKEEAARNDGGNGRNVVGDGASVRSSSTAAATGEGGGPNEGSLLLDEELAALRGERRGLPPVMLVPAAARVARDAGVLTAAAAATTANGVRTLMDPVLSTRWASQIRRSMEPAERSRAREDMRPMAYRVVPEVWKRLCPASLWDATEESGGVECEGAKNTEGASEGEAAETNDGTAAAESAVAPGSHSFALLRNPSPARDEDAHAVFSHLHGRSDLHVADGALFGCDFLLYDGRREDRHSFAGLRVLHDAGGAAAVPSGGGEEEVVRLLPTPSAYDAAGFVRAMNTARKIALAATVVWDGDVARVAIVDLALEKVLEAPTHARRGRGEGDMRRSAEDAAKGLSRH